MKPHLQRRVEMRVALHRHPGAAGVMEAAAEILQAISGVELVDLNQPAVGLQSFNIYRRCSRLSPRSTKRPALCSLSPPIV
jgi:hypothetical protein